MGKKGTKRKTRWRALPLGEEDGGSGNEEELLDEDQSTTSSVVGGQAPNNFRANPAVFKASDKPYRQARRFPYDKFRHKEPLIKLESKTFDEEEYTKITTPRQDVLFKKGYFGRKRESSIEESVYNANEVEGEEPVMDQIIITNGFVDERGHYLVNGSSYEIYDPYTNTVTVVVGPPPYANGVTPPVLAAVSCQPVPLQPVDWYPPGNEWPSQSTAWTPTYHPNPPHSADSISSPGQSCESTPTSIGSEGQIPNLYHHPAFVPAVPHNFVYEPPVYNVNGGNYQDSVSQTTEVMCSNDNLKLKKTRRKSQETVNGNQVDSIKIEEKTNNQSVTAIETTKTTQDSLAIRIEDNKGERNGMQLQKQQQQTPSTNNEQKESCPVEPFAKPVEKQSHSTQTNLIESQEQQQKQQHQLQQQHPQQHPPPPQQPQQITQNKSAEIRVKESHSTQTNPDETFPNKNNNNKNNLDSVKLKEFENNETNRNLSDILLSSITKKDQEPPKVPAWKTVYYNNNSNGKFQQKTSPKKGQEDSPKKIYQKRTNFNERKEIPSPVEASPVKTVSYAKKVMNGLENGSIQGNSNINNVKKLCNGSNTVMNGSSHISQNVNNNNTNNNNLNKTPLTNGTNKQNFVENRRNNQNRVNGNVRNNNYYERPRFNRSLSNGKQQQQQQQQQKKVQIAEKVQQEKCVEVSESRSQSEKSSIVSELSSPTELSSGQNTPPEKLIVKKMEDEINKSFEEKLKQNLTKEEEKLEEEEEIVVCKKKPEKKKKKETEKQKETPKSKSKKNKKKQSEDSAAHDYSNQDIPFLQPYIQEKTDEFWVGEKVKSPESDLISDIDSLLTANDNNILKSLGISEDKLNLSKLPLSSGFLKMLPTFNQDRPKFKFDDYFASTSTKQLHSDLATKTNITNMKSTKPEEFFASIIENPGEVPKGKGTKNKKDEVLEDTETDKKETVKEANNHGAQVIVKKSLSIPKTGYNKINKNNLKCIKGEKAKEVAEKKNEEKPEEVKLGIVEAVNSWLKEEGDEKLLSVNSLPQSFEKIESSDDDDDEEKSPIQKNGLGNSIPASRVDNDEKADEGVSDGGMRVATTKENTRRYRSSSLDAKLSEKKIKKFLTESASYYSDLIGDVRNGVSLEYAREELCDPKQSVLKYYTLSPGHKSKKPPEEDDEVFDVLEYKFKKNDESKKNPSEHQFPNKEVCNCKLQ